MPEQNRFYSKILLFGEYALILGSQALSIPYGDLYGYFSSGPAGEGNQILDSNAHLKKYAAFLQQQPQLKQLLDLALFEKDIEDGLIFKSNIPLGYGLGSSGALVAAVYHRYAIEKIPSQNLVALKQVLAAMESWFHGKSSGLDPLICYLNRAVLLEGNERLKTVVLPSVQNGAGGTLFLLDTGTVGETRPLVNYFMQQSQRTAFLEKIKNRLIPLNGECIRAYLRGDAGSLSGCMKSLSVFTLEYFHPMIPEKLLSIWQKGLADEHFFLKLCGSGGGGMMLGFTRNFEKTKEIIKPFSVKIFQQL